MSADTHSPAFSAISSGLVPLDVVISTAELNTRPTRAPDFEAENRALVTLAKDMAGAPRDILRRLAETALQLCRAGSCGVRVIESDGGAGVFRWHALVGGLSDHLWGTECR